jgi:hypothetical protein
VDRARRDDDPVHVDDASLGLPTQEQNALLRVEHLRIREDAVEHLLADYDALDRQGQRPPKPTK